MVYKVKFLRYILLFLLIFGLIFAAVKINRNVETNLVKTILPEKIIKTTDILPVADKSSSIIKVVFESDNEDDLENLKLKFEAKIDKEYFDTSAPNLSNLVDKYTKSPANFLSIKTRKMIQDAKYDEIYSKAIERIYNPVGLQMSTLDKDPYLLFDDFIAGNNLKPEGIHSKDGTFYDYMTVKIKNKQGLSPTLSNKKVGELIESQKTLSVKNSKIYLAGSPVHSYYTSKSATRDINIICILSTLLIMFLTWFYFRNLKNLIPIALSIMCGMLAGYIATKLFFNNFQVLTMVFSATLIGIGIDYSYHYFFSEKIDRTFVKNLTFSMLTTIIPFGILYFTGIEILRQIAIYIIFGLFTIYLFVLIFYPCFEITKPQKTYKYERKYSKYLFYILIFLGCIGFFKLHFNDSLSSLYVPKKDLLKAETIYNKVSGNENKNFHIITVKGDNIQQILEREEFINDILNKNGQEYYSISRFFPSVKRQKDNFNLVKTLYKNNIMKFSDVLTPSQISALNNQVFKGVEISTEDLGIFSDFMLNDRTSLIFANTKQLDLPQIEGIGQVNVSRDISVFINKYRKTLFKIFPIAILSVLLILSAIYGFKRSLKIIVPPLCGILFSAGLVSLFYGELNLFSVISLFLIFGFTIDYSIFRASNETSSEDAIFVSSLTTAFSFFLLSVTSFKLINSMASILFLGIVIAYLAGKIIFLPEEKNPDNYENWYEISEKSAGKIRLKLTYLCYKLFGIRFVYVIAFFVTFFTLIANKKLRDYSKKYLEIVSQYTDIKPSLINIFKHVYSYSGLLCDKLQIQAGDFKPDRLVFANEEDKKLLSENLLKKKGMVFLSGHLGNIDVLKSMFMQDSIPVPPSVNVIMSNSQSKIFNEFLNTISKDFPLKIFASNEISPSDAITIKENLDKGEILFIAGDRLSENPESKTVTVEIFKHNIALPLGAFKFALLTEIPIYLISAVKIKQGKYKIYMKQCTQNDAENLAKEYAKFLEQLIKIYPLQFYHFYDFFKN